MRRWNNIYEGFKFKFYKSKLAMKGAFLDSKLLASSWNLEMFISRDLEEAAANPLDGKSREGLKWRKVFCVSVKWRRSSSRQTFLILYNHSTSQKLLFCYNFDQERLCPSYHPQISTKSCFRSHSAFFSSYCSALSPQQPQLLPKVTEMHGIMEPVAV